MLLFVYMLLHVTRLQVVQQLNLVPHKLVRIYVRFTTMRLNHEPMITMKRTALVLLLAVPHLFQETKSHELPASVNGAANIADYF